MSPVYSCFYRVSRLFHSLFDCNGAGDGRADHRVVAHADKTHHLDVRRNGGGTCELGVGVHTAHGVGHAVAGGACRHVVGVQGAARAAAGSDGEIVDAVLDAPLLVGACNRMLEAGRVGGVSGDGNSDVLKLHDSHALGNVVCAVALDVGSRAVGISLLLGDGDSLRIGVKLRLAVCEAVYAGDYHSGILAKAVEDNSQGLCSDLVRVEGYFDSALCCGEALMTCEEAEALRLLGEEHLSEVAVAEADLAVFGDGAGNAEGLETDADCGSGVRSLDSAALYCDGAADGVCPNSVIEADGLGTSDDLVAVDALCKSYIFALLDGGNAVLSENGIDFVNSSLIVFK